MKAYSPEFRRDVLAACDTKVGTRAVALKFRVSESWVRRIQQELRVLGKMAPFTTRKRVPKWPRPNSRVTKGHLGPGGQSTITVYSWTQRSVGRGSVNAEDLYNSRDRGSLAITRGKPNSLRTQTKWGRFGIKNRPITSCDAHTRNGELQSRQRIPHLYTFAH